MIDQRLKTIIISRIDMLVEGQGSKLRKEIERLTADAASSGFPSMAGHTQDQIRELYERYFYNLTLLIIQELRDVLLKAKPMPSQDLSIELMNILSSYASTTDSDRLFSEIDLIMRELDYTENKDQRTTIYNINSNRGIVQTGDTSKVKIININNSDRDELYKILDLMANILSKADDFKNHKIDEVNEVLDEVKDEISKNNPNRMRLSSLLIGFATTVQSIASVKPAYEALKAAALHIGIDLP